MIGPYSRESCRQSLTEESKGLFPIGGDNTHGASLAITKGQKNAPKHIEENKIDDWKADGQKEKRGEQEPNAR